MIPLDNLPVIDSLVVKVASRCNLNCDYCYMYHHVDQSYKRQPRFFDKAHAMLLGQRIREYLFFSGQKSFSVCFHGGEPLLAGYERIKSYLEEITAPLDKDQSIRFTIQTNGTLLTTEFLELFREKNAQVCVSLDGPQAAHDKHRLDHQGRSSFARTFQALSLLNTTYRDVFAGVLSVLDPTNSSEELLDFFASFNLPFYDILLPDANHLVPPPGRAKDPDLYVRWLKRAFTYWYHHHRDLPVRLFTSACKAVGGLPLDTEIFGNGNISYLILETDGSYHYSDLLKAAYEGASKTDHHLATSSLQQVCASLPIKRYQDLLRPENLCDTCFKCPEKALCGGGQISHRYGKEGFHNPTIYCQEMLHLIQDARRHVFTQRAQEIAFKPQEHRDELISVFFSEHAVYLLAALTRQSIPSSEDVKHMLPQDELAITQTLLAAFTLIEKAYPHLPQEIVLFLPTFSFSLEKRPEEKTPSLQAHDKTPLLLALCPYTSAERLLEAFFQKKLALFHHHYPLINPASWQAFEAFYCSAYRGRFWQLLALHQKEYALSEKFLEERNRLERLTESLHIGSYSEMGKYFFSALLDEFIPTKTLHIGEYHGCSC